MVTWEGGSETSTLIIFDRIGIDGYGIERGLAELTADYVQRREGIVIPGLTCWTLRGFTVLHIQKAAKEASARRHRCQPAAVLLECANWGVSVIILRGLFKVRKSKLLCCICQHLHAIIIFALSVSLQMFLFLQCLQEWPSHPSALPIQRNQIYSGLSTRLVGTICLKQTLRAPRLSLTSVHKYNLIKFNLRGGVPRRCFLNAVDENNHVCLVFNAPPPPPLIFFFLFSERAMNFPASFICSSASAQAR